MRFTRRGFIALGIGSAVAAVTGIGYTRFVEPTWLALRRARIDLKSPPRGSVRALHLSDLHWSSVVPISLIRDAVNRAMALTPDAIFLTGDFVTSRDERDLAEYRLLLRELAAAAPCLAVLGNHDGGAWSARRGGRGDTHDVTDLLESAGVRVLSNSVAELPGSGLTVVGLADLWSGDFRPKDAFAGVTDVGRPVVVLAHNPDTKEAIARFRWEVMLSGHTHGGQIVVPLIGAPYAPVEDRRYLAGLKPWRDRQIHVSRGVGNLAGLRFNCRPEMTLLEIA